MKIQYQKFIMFVGLLLVGVYGRSTIHTVSMSTGAVNNTNPVSLIPVTQADDTWLVYHSGLTGFTNVGVGTGWYYSATSFPTSFQWPCSSPNAQWISPFLNANGIATGVSSTLGDMIYRNIFDLSYNPCHSIDLAEIVLANVAGDNKIYKIVINNNTTILTGIGFFPCSSGVVINIPNPTSVFHPGVNYIDVYVENQGSVCGLFMDGDLVLDINPPAPLQANFNFTAAAPFCSSGQMIFDATSSNGPIVDHSWFVWECDQFGNTIPAGIANGGGWSSGAPGIFNLTAVWPTIQCGKYYNVQLKVKDQCGNVYNSAIQKFFWACEPPIYLAGSTSEICFGGSGFINTGTSLTGNYNVTISPFPYSGTIYNGPANTQVPISPTTNMTYQITMTDLNTGCSSVAYWNTTMVYNSIPINLQGSTSSVCNGGSGYISAALPIGYNASNYLMTIYEQPLNNVVYSGMPNAAVMVTPPGNGPSATYTIQVKDLISGCISTATWTIEIDHTPFPVDLVGNHTVCPGGSTSINVSLPGGVSGYSMTVYAFTGSFGPQIYSGPVTNLSVSPTSNTNYVLYITDNSTGCTSTANFPVTVVNNLTTMSAAPIQCKANGITVNGSASVGPFNSHVWTLVKCNSAGVPIPASPVISVFQFGQPGVYTFSAVAANLLCDNYYRIRLNATDICGNQTSIIVQKVVLVKCCPPSPQDPPPSNMPEAVTVVYNNQDDLEALYQQFNDNTLSTNSDRIFVEEVMESALTIYPNPTTGNATLTYAINENATGKIVVTDLSGRVIRTEILTSGKNSVDVDLTEYKNGIYFVNLFEDDQLIQTEKLILNH